MSHQQESPEYVEIPHTGRDKSYRRVISPGLFEFVRHHEDTGVKTRQGFLNALQPVEVCEALLVANERAGEIITGGKTISFASNYVSAYDKGEDRVSVSAVSFESLKGAQHGTWWAHWADLQADAGEKDLLFFTVIDGHLGGEICDLLEKAGNACMGWAIANSERAMAGDEGAMMQALIDVVLTMNQDVSAAPLEILRHPATATAGHQLPGMPSIAQLIKGHLERGGACIATAVVDLRHQKLYVVNAGDCRVLALREEDEDWSTEVLTQDHNGDNPREVARVKAEHPNDPNAMMNAGRGWHKMIGLNQVTRCVGDVALNRTQETRDALLKGAMTESAYPFVNAVDPPYVGWTPEVEVRNLDTDRTMILVLGTDGLYDKLTNEEVSRAAIEAIQRDRNGSGNPATHLIKAALGRGDETLLRQMLSLKHGTRSFRDDTSALVVSFGV